MATVYDVARQAGVSTATVSRVMRGSDLVHPETRQRVIEVIERLGFVPDASAQGLSRRRKDIIGLVALERGSGEIDIERSSLLFVDEIVHAAEAVLRGSEVSLLLSFGRRGESFERRIRSLSGKVDGLLMAEDVLPADQLGALARRVPVVLIAGPAGTAGLDVIAVDNTGGIRAAASHLTGTHGYRRLCFVGGPADSPDARQRLAAFGAAVRATPGCTADAAVDGDFSEASGSAAGRVLLARARLPEAVVCANDQMAIGLLREFRRAGVPVPSSGRRPGGGPAGGGRAPGVAVTGFDDIYPSRLADPPLTTVSQPVRELGSRAAQRLLALISDRASAAAGAALRAGGPPETDARRGPDDRPPAAGVLAPVTEVLPTRLVIRASCGCEATGEG
jgi:LacI family transcriptional regulator